MAISPLTVPETTLTKLLRVQALIKTLEESAWSSMTVGDRQTTQKQLDSAYEREKTLLAEYAEEQNGGAANGPIRVRGIEIDV